MSAPVDVNENRNPAYWNEKLDQLQLDSERRTMVERRMIEMPLAYRRRYLLAVSGKSLRAAATAFCSECICWVRKEVTNCTSLECALYPYRPFQKSRKRQPE